MVRRYMLLLALLVPMLPAFRAAMAKVHPRPRPPRRRRLVLTFGERCGVNVIAGDRVLLQQHSGGPIYSPNTQLGLIRHTVVAEVDQTLGKFESHVCEWAGPRDGSVSVLRTEVRLYSNLNNAASVHHAQPGSSSRMVSYPVFAANDQNESRIERKPAHSDAVAIARVGAADLQCSSDQLRLSSEGRLNDTDAAWYMALGSTAAAAVEAVSDLLSAARAAGRSTKRPVCVCFGTATRVSCGAHVAERLRHH
eukprot:TRINITY_DN15851_c0_g1_i1.p1 TRINITY_DN15851_c0_g1~~TRINITY_DN15851_c0_g1_i1.p1  ORF type:complete len:251 (+),score=24.80 TRINITY_DN15851_c0_g1_i1:61-813(+)